MARCVRVALVAGGVAVMAVPQAHAIDAFGKGTWETTLKGRDLDGNAGNGFEAYYDTALDITWLADANFAKTSGYTSAANGGVDDQSVYGTNVKWTDGRMGWDAAKTWAANLNVSGVTGWRLPTMTDTGTLGCNLGFGGTDCGYNVDTNTSELAHMFQVTLGNVSTLDSVGNFNRLSPIGTGTFSTAFFKNVIPDPYWSGLAFAPTPGGAWYFHPLEGYQHPAANKFGHYAWAVHSGDVAAGMVPEPQAYALALAGLAAALAARGRPRRLEL